MKTKLSIIKIGGSIIEDEDELDKMLQIFNTLDGLKILIHGGGKLATTLGQKLGIKTEMVNGRRITDEESLKLITMVYGGLVNKKIVAILQSLNCNAIGLSGADANSIQANIRPKKPIDFGFVGDVKKVDGTQIAKFINMGLTPVFCPISHDQNGQLLNTNADTVAAEMAIALSEFFNTSLYYCFEKKGVLKDMKDANTVIKKLDETSYQELKSQGLIFDGMLPKLENCFHVLKNNGNSVQIGQYHMLTDRDAVFTKITL